MVTTFRHSRGAYSKVSDGMLPKFKLIQAFMVGLLICKNEENPFKKLKALEWSQHFSHYKAMGIISHAQVQLPPQSNVRNLNQSEFLWVSLLPARIKKIQLKSKVLEWSQHYPSILRCSRGANFIIGIMTKFNFIQAFIVVLLICKNEEDPFLIKKH